jgi:GNAT superfamily N-acetyltransferase
VSSEIPHAGLRAVRLSEVSAAERERLLCVYEREVYVPAFPDAEIREDPAYWLGLLGADPYPPPPQPRIEVILLLGAADAVAGGVTVEYYRTAGCGLLTYIAIAEDRRGQGLGRWLVGEAEAALARMASAPLLFAETERLEDAHDDAERAATILRQTRLAGLGARLVDYDYWMPPLRPGLPAHQLHLMVFDRAASEVAAATVAGLMAELAAALGADLDAHAETRAMMAWLAGQDGLAIRPLPAARAKDPA